MPKKALPELVDTLHLRSSEDLFVALGDGSMSVNNVIRRLIPDAAKPHNATVVRHTEPTGRVLVEGEKLSYTLASCCLPIFPVPIIGYVTRGKGVTVHALGCRNLPNDSERYVKCRWETTASEQEHLACSLELHAVDRIGLISDVTRVIASDGYNIDGMTTTSNAETNETVERVGVEVPDLFALAQLIRKLERIQGVKTVRRVG
jgi:GTP pyrophosphokinase